MNPLDHAVYLGDGVYIRKEYGNWVLLTSDGMAIANRIVLEPEVYEALVNYVARSRTDGDTITKKDRVPGA